MTADELMEEIENLPPEERAKVRRFVRIHNMARLIFTDAGAVWEWMNSPAPGLDDKTPIGLLDTEAGAEKVQALIEGIARGHVM